MLYEVKLLKALLFLKGKPMSSSFWKTSIFSLLSICYYFLSNYLVNQWHSQLVKQSIAASLFISFSLLWELCSDKLYELSWDIEVVGTAF